jgi:hypothetical protein
MDDTLPLDSRLLEIDEKTDGEAGSSQIVETLHRVFAGETLHTTRRSARYPPTEQPL